MATIEVMKDSKGQFRFRVKAKNGEIIATSESYKQKPKALATIKALQSGASSAKVIDLTVAKVDAKAGKSAKAGKKPAAKAKPVAKKAAKPAKPAAKPAAKKPKAKAPAPAKPAAPAEAPMVSSSDSAAASPPAPATGNGSQSM